MPNKTIAPSKKRRNRKIDRERNHKNRSPKMKVSMHAIETLFNKKTLRKLAKDTGFIQRERKLDPYDFFYH